jgi:hypothetical protein
LEDPAEGFKKSNNNIKKNVFIMGIVQQNRIRTRPQTRTGKETETKNLSKKRQVGFMYF